jgi:hypothetical protein
MRGFADIDRIVVPAARVREAQAHLRRVGEQGAEGFALWAGAQHSTTFLVRATCIPAQEALRFEKGLCVRVDGPELHRINMWLYEQGLTLIAQLHSHPGVAYHSTTDDAYPIATTVGSLSIVIPDFARSPFSIVRCAVYRLSVDGQWNKLSTDAVRRLIHIKE